MHYQTLAAALAIAAPMVAGAPTNKPRAAGFTVEQVSTGKTVSKNGPAAYQKALQKYRMNVPSSVAAAAATQSGSVTNNPAANDEEYTCPVQIGGQTLNLDFDTGSSDLWVFSTETKGSTSGHTLYKPSSSAKQLSGYTWDISYGDGSGASGNVYADTVVVGGVTATSQAVEAATSIAGSAADSFSGSDGLLGLASSSINTVKPKSQTTFFDTVISSLPAGLFTATLKHGAPGSYDFGYIDDSKHSGDIVYTPIDFSQGFWQFTAGDYSISGSDSGTAVGTAIADTGTTLALLPDNVISDYYSNIPSATNNQQAGGYTFSCTDTPPDFAINVGGTDFTIAGALINFAPNGDGTCFGGLQSNSGESFSILGDVFLKNVYAVFDEANSQIGFAPQA